ncbi:unnamed protein product [Brassica napus]|uniref:(rape) hypothetical protein n=1 Tax=Brassica napus TaxID=3708 RepID=A0A816LK53_BRANA|nr:unnamed protein product [Brassica napus]
MDPVVIVSGNWIKKNIYVFNVERRGCRVLYLDEKTTHEDFSKTITENIAREKSKTFFSFSSEVEASIVESRDENYSGSYDGCSLEKEQEDHENDCSSNVLRLEMSSIDIAVGELYKNFLGDVGPAVRPTSVGIAITKQFGIKVITLLWLSYFNDTAE